MKKLFNFLVSDLRRVSFYATVTTSLLVLVSFQNCGKVKFSVQRDPNNIVSQSCGTITMSPPNGLDENTSVSFTVTPPNGITISNLAWSVTKGTNSNPVHTSSTNPLVHTFNHTGEGSGDYLATAVFQKSDGNNCELAKSFQILSGDICVNPSGISGPAVGFVGEETSPFSVDYEDCYVGNVIWDMNTDGTPEYNNNITDSVTYTYNTPGTFTVTARTTNTEDNSQTILTRQIVISYANCTNSATNPPLCNVCLAGNVLVGGQCIPNCTNGTTNPPTCNQCPAGQSFVNGQCIANCSNGATNPPTCNLCPAGQSLVNGQCTPNCSNGTTNPPTCNQCPTGQSLVNGQCTSSCSNGATNPPTCNQCPTGQSLVNGQCTPNCSNGATNPPTCNQCPAGKEFFGGTCVDQCPLYQTRDVNGVCQNNPPTCTNGTIVNGQCMRNCTTVKGTIVTHGQSVSATLVPRTQNACCKTETRTCNNGVIQGFPSGYVEGQSCGIIPTCTTAACGSAHGRTFETYMDLMNVRSQWCALGSTISQGNINDGLQYDGSKTYVWHCETLKINAVQCSAKINTIQSPPSYTYSWNAPETWGACSATACGTSGTESRSVTCQRNDGVTVVDSYCSGTKPTDSRACSAPACPPPTPPPPPSSAFTKSSCGFSLYSSNWSGTAGQPSDGYNSCEWAGSMYMGSSNLVEAIFMFGDYYDGQIWRLTNPSQWTITAVGCTLNTIHDPKDITKGMPNYCKASGTKSYGGSTPLVWNATITARNKNTGEVRVLPITATFKPTLRSKP